MFSKFIGVTPEVAALIEARRTGPEETESEILLKALSEKEVVSRTDGGRRLFHLGEGAKVHVGELLYLFLNEQAKRAGRPDGVAEVHSDGISINGQKVQPSKGSYIQPAMRFFQERKKHFNEKGELISLSAWRQWHVLREGKWVRLEELKDPGLAKKRSRYLPAGFSLNLEGIKL